MLIEPSALDVEQLETWNPACERKGVDRELRDRPVGARVRLIVEHVHAAVAHLQEIDVPGDGAWLLVGAWR